MTGESPEKDVIPSDPILDKSGGLHMSQEPTPLSNEVDYVEERTVQEILRDSINDLIKLARVHELTEAEIDETLLGLLADRLQDEDENYVMEQFRIAKADLLRNKFKIV